MSTFKLQLDYIRARHLRESRWAGTPVADGDAAITFQVEHNALVTHPDDTILAAAERADGSGG